MSEMQADPQDLNPYAATVHVSDPNQPVTDADVHRRTYLSHEASVQSIGSLYVLGGVVLLLLFSTSLVLSLVEFSSGGIAGERATVSGVILVAVFGLFPAIGICQIVIGVGLCRLRNWA